MPKILRGWKMAQKTGLWIGLPFSFTRSIDIFCAARSYYRNKPFCPVECRFLSWNGESIKSYQGYCY